MTIKEFLEKHNNAPYEFREIAELLTEITDDKDVAGTAKAYLESRENLEISLDDMGFEFG